MTVSELSDLGALELRLAELEGREAAIEHSLAPLLERQRAAPDSVVQCEVAALRKAHLETRRELNTIRARLVPLPAR
jgi:predicted  nucleic acid-binding Zn-ribbon protein